MRLWAVCTVLLMAILQQTATGQVAGDYRTTGSGNWNSAATWQRFNGTSWLSASTPTNAVGAITLQTGHTVTIPSGFIVAADQFIVNGTLVIAAGGQLTLAHGTVGTDLTVSSGSQIQVSGVFQRNNLSTIDAQNDAARFSFLAGSEYRHGYTTTFGTLPYASWATTSTIVVQGYANTTVLTADASWNQSIGNFTYNCTGSRSTVDYANNLRTIRGNFTMQHTGSGILQLSTNQNQAITILGNFTAVLGRINFATTGNAAVVTVQGNFAFNASNTAGSYLTYTGNTTLNIHGDFTMNATANGRLHLGNTGSTGVSTINFSGNFNLMTGRIDELGANPTQATLRFVGSGLRTFGNTGTITGYINFYISPTTVLNVGTSPVISSSPATFRLAGTIIVGSLDPKGAIQTVTTAGNIRTANTYRTYLPGSRVVYGGAGPQFMGNGQPTGVDATTVINNTSGVTLVSNVIINGALTLQSGSLNLSNLLLTLNGTVASTGGGLGGTALSKLTIGGTTGGSAGTLVFTPAAAQVGILTLNRTGTDAGVTLNSTLQVDSLFNLTNGVFTNTSGLTMRNHATIFRDNTATLAGVSPVVIGSSTYNVYYRTVTPVAGPFVPFATGPELPINATALGDLTVRTARDQNIVQLDKSITINGTFYISRGSFEAGAFTMTMNGPSWRLDGTGQYVPGTGTVIFNGTTLVDGTINPTFNNIQLNTGKSLTFTRNTTINGNLTFQPGATFAQGTTTVILGGGNAQTVSAGGVPIGNTNIAKTGGAGVQLSSTFNLMGLLQFVSPSTNVTVASNGYLVVRSTSDAAGAAGQGSIYRLASGNTVSGDVTVERYISPEGRMYRYLSSPVTNAMVSQWKDDFPITGRFKDPSPQQTICGEVVRTTTASMFYYNEPTAGAIDAGYVAYPVAGTFTTNSPLVAGRGYSAYIRECTNPTVVDVTGPINQGIFTFPISYTATPNADANGWNLVGNPYPATIDWDITGWTRTRVSTTISIMDNATGMVRYYEPGVTNDIPNGMIAAGQAFFVRATGASPVLRLQEVVKVTNTVEFFRERAPLEIPSFSLTLSDGTQYDAAYVKLVADALPGLDSLDAPKLYNPTFSFSTLATDNRAMAINAISGLRCNDSFPLEMKDATEGSYTITLNTKVISGYQFLLTDRYLGKTVALKGDGYAFTVDGKEGSNDPQRFSVTVTDDVLAGISVTAPAVVDNVTAAYTVNVAGTSTDVSYTLVNSTGTLIAGPVQGNGNEIAFPLSATVLQDGTNELTISALGGCSPVALTTSFAVEKALSGFGVEENGGVSVKAYPNPVGDQLTLEITDADVRGIEFTSAMGQRVLAVPVVTGQTVYTVDVSTLRSGVYLMVVDKRTIKKSYRLIKK